MDWNGIPQAASFQFGPRTKWIPQGTLRATSEMSYGRNPHCQALLSKCIPNFHGSLVRHVLLPETEPVDAIIISIDLEGLDIHETLRCPMSIRIATLDTRTLFDTSVPPSDKIHTQIFHRGSFKETQSCCHKRSNGRYLFSEREQFYKKTAMCVLERIFTHERRNVILLGHGMETDLNFLALMSFKPDEHACITDVLDTGLIASGVFTCNIDMGERVERAGFRVEKSLEDMLKELGFKRKEFHNAANDANFTLRALLLLLARELKTDQTYWTKNTASRVEMLQFIGLEPLPKKACPIGPPRLENLRPEAVAANRAKKNARKTAEQDLDLADSLRELAIESNVA